MEEEKKKKVTGESLKKALGLYRYIAPYKYRFIAGLIFLIFSGASTLAIFNYMGDLIDVQSSNISEKVREISIIMVGILLIQAVASYFRVTLFAQVTENAIAQIRKDVYERLIKLPMAYFRINGLGSSTAVFQPIFPP
jgi:ABC-type multidrug transport system fused ATPase/permease subunit